MACTTSVASGVAVWYCNATFPHIMVMSELCYFKGENSASLATHRPNLLSRPQVLGMTAGASGEAGRGEN